MVDVRCTGAVLCRSTGILQPPYFLMFLSMLPYNYVKFSCEMDRWLMPLLANWQGVGLNPTQMDKDFLLTGSSYCPPE